MITPSGDTVHLYQIADEIRDALAEIAEADGELGVDIEDRWDTLQASLEQKVEATALYLREREGLAGRIRDEEKRLAERRRAIEAGVERLKGYVEFQMRRLDRDRIETDLSVVSIVNNSRPSVVVNDPDALPDEFVTLRRVPNKAALADAALSGDTLPDGVTVTRGTHLRIR